MFKRCSFSSPRVLRGTQARLPISARRSCGRKYGQLALNKPWARRKKAEIGRFWSTEVHHRLGLARGKRREPSQVIWVVSPRPVGRSRRGPSRGSSKRMVRKSYRPGSQFPSEGPVASWLQGLSVRFEPSALPGDNPAGHPLHRRHIRCSKKAKASPHPGAEGGPNTEHSRSVSL